MVGVGKNTRCKTEFARSMILAAARHGRAVTGCHVIAATAHGRNPAGGVVVVATTHGREAVAGEIILTAADRRPRRVEPNRVFITAANCGGHRYAGGLDPVVGSASDDGADAFDRVEHPAPDGCRSA